MRSFASAAVCRGISTVAIERFIRDWPGVCERRAWRRAILRLQPRTRSTDRRRRRAFPSIDGSTLGTRGHHLSDLRFEARPSEEQEKLMHNRGRIPTAGDRLMDSLYRA